MQAKLDAWRGENEDLKKVIEIYEYLLLNLNEINKIDKTSSELECFFPTYNILNILFRNTDVKIVIGEKGCNVTKTARMLSEKSTTFKKPSNVYGRKIDLMLMHGDTVLCCAEWKSMSASIAMIKKQFVKNLRVNKCVLFDLCQKLNDDGAEILAMDWRGKYILLHIDIGISSFLRIAWVCLYYEED
ncbi:uncharacterized protein B0P05DRAFT_249086 [Gilbertella persicaria]|nr:uncharacterized protein B0P05DRAFT_249086 [Gilbertella persicaria]KAI8061864.1 hypothetical protein B0P05DRAFT_249086 [Gilbertella persicaria]